MASIKDLKKRIGTVKNTQQTTRAMKMVSAAKLRRAQDAIVANRPYAAQLKGLLKRIAQEPGVSLEHPLLRTDAASSQEAGQKVRTLLLVVSSDRGLCGGFNSNVFRAAQRWVRERADSHEVTLAFLGRKGFEFFRGRRDMTVGRNFAELSGKVAFAKASKLATALIEEFSAGNFDEIHVVYNEFKNAVSQKVVTEQFLPLGLSAGDGAAQDGAPLLVRPGAQALFDSLVDKSFSVQMYRIMLDSQASEHGARMSAMENATKNAGEMIKKLALQYNKQRQANITKELLEIISGSESQKAS
jgi:F-type H+-transporting ATPase subunit gamma